VSEDTTPRRKHWGREVIAEAMSKLEEEPPVVSQRQVAEELGLPRSTLQHWLERRDTLDADPAVVAFFESPAGAAFLHRLVVAAHLVMTLVGPCGIRQVCLFLELTGLHVFVAASYGPQQKVSVAIEKAVVEFDQAEKQRLAQGMPPKQITVCQDETFHPETCLVAIEPVSNYILLEKYVENRKAETWTQSMAAATKGVPVELVQSTSDEGRGIRHHVEEDLGIHHSPDVFHVQHDVVQGSSVVLANRKRQAEQSVAEAAQQVSRLKEAQSTNVKQEGPSDGAAALVQPGVTAQAQEQKAREALETIVGQHKRVQEAVAGISTAYHPYDLETGTAQSVDQVADALARHWSEIEVVAAEASLPERCVKKIQKAKRVVVEMIATLAFFWLTVRAKVEALSLTPAVEQAVYNHLIPAIYLHLVSEKTSDPQQRQTLQTKSDELLAPLVCHDGPLAGLEQAEVRVIETVALECARVFQRSSSCVEGRNGQLALRHHSLHRLTNRKLAALTTVHNYFIRRCDGTTAAERFFGAKPKDLFAWILERVDLPGWSAQKRSQPQPKAYLLQATT
jgi:hypothetical protein